MISGKRLKKQHRVGSRACVVPFFHIDPLNKGLGDEEEAPRTPSSSPPPPSNAPAARVRTGTKSWDIREKKKHLFQDGLTNPLMKAMCYKARKTANANARKEWVLQHGMEVPVPQSLWPKMPTGEWRPWVPPLHWLTLEQSLAPHCEKYLQQMAIIKANYDAHVQDDQSDEPDPDMENLPWRTSRSSHSSSSRAPWARSRGSGH